MTEELRTLIWRVEAETEEDAKQAVRNGEGVEVFNDFENRTIIGVTVTEE